MENNLEIIPIINKIDLPSADPMIYPKTGLNVYKVLESIIKYILIIMFYVENLKRLYNDY